MFARDFKESLDVAARCAPPRRDRCRALVSMPECETLSIPRGVPLDAIAPSRACQYGFAVALRVHSWVLRGDQNPYAQVFARCAFDTSVPKPRMPTLWMTSRDAGLVANPHERKRVRP